MPRKYTKVELLSDEVFRRKPAGETNRKIAKSILIRFAKAVPPEKRASNLLEKLAVERDGIFMWALAGLKRLIASSYLFFETEAARVELQRTRWRIIALYPSWRNAACSTKKRNVSARSCFSNTASIATKTA